MYIRYGAKIKNAQHRLGYFPIARLPLRLAGNELRNEPDIVRHTPI